MGVLQPPLRPAAQLDHWLADSWQRGQNESASPQRGSRDGHDEGGPRAAGATVARARPFPHGDARPIQSWGWDITKPPEVSRGWYSP